ncbi:hypothetical protein AX17_006031 [Amanita inopinata Kibby_2008]|nr:hypothetical protein AX17_006031 [Amanita inopinata Kibby_2008]
MHTPSNPDTRPLPSGWHQHYDSEYYVQINVLPPKVSYTHPASLENPPPTAMMPIPDIPTQPKMTPVSGDQPSTGAKMSLAQQLYANAINKKTATAGPGRVHLASPPSSPSPPNLQRRPPSISPPTTLSELSSGNVQRGAPTEFYNSIVAAQCGGPTFAPRANTASGSLRLHRSQSSQPPNYLQYQPHRATTTGSVQIHNLNKNNRQVVTNPTRRGDTPTISMVVCPPLAAQQTHRDSLSSPPLHAGLNPASPPQQVVSPPNTPYSPSSASSPSTSSTISTPPNLSPTTPYQLPGPYKPNASFSGAANTMTVNANGSKTSVFLRALGLALARSTGRVALQTGSALLQSMGLNQIFGIGGDVFLNILSGLASSSMSGLNMAQIAAVLQGQPGANYQAVINAILRQQGLIGHSPGLNYHALILALQALQKQSSSFQGQVQYGNVSQPFQPQNQVPQQSPSQQVPFQQSVQNQPAMGPQRPQMYQPPPAQQQMSQQASYQTQWVGQQQTYQGQGLVGQQLSPQGMYQSQQQQSGQFNGQQQGQTYVQQGFYNTQQSQYATQQQHSALQQGEQLALNAMHTLLSPHHGQQHGTGQDNTQDPGASESGGDNSGDNSNQVYNQVYILDYTQPPADTGGDNSVPPEYNWDSAAGFQISGDDGSYSFSGFADALPASDGSGMSMGGMVDGMGQLFPSDGGSSGVVDGLGQSLTSLSFDGQFNISLDDNC